MHWYTYFLISYCANSLPKRNIVLKILSFQKLLIQCSSPRGNVTYDSSHLICLCLTSDFTFVTQKKSYYPTLTYLLKMNFKFCAYWSILLVKRHRQTFIKQLVEQADRLVILNLNISKCIFIFILAQLLTLKKCLIIKF